jgi:UDP-N-acetylglucosamine--N-acetylmuramyl-(pentapeptide) pyrophosphoryl-undecaprenol N-acetylglucosamine transferase
MTPRPVAQRWDPWLMAPVLLLVAFGLVMVYSSSAVFAGEKLGDGAYYLKRQALWALAGALGMAAMLKLGYRRLEPLAYPGLVLAMALLALVLAPGIGHVAGGARRWIQLGPVGFQPGEIAKVALVVYLARSCARKRSKMRLFTIGFLPHCIVTAAMVVLLLRQPDFGTAVTCVVLLGSLLFAAGARLGYLAAAVVAAAPAAGYLVISQPYRLERIRAFLDPFADPRGSGYQLAESLMAFGSGGMSGLGLGEGKQKLFYLPAAHTDFILPMIGEELGFAGVLLVVALFAVLLWRGFRAAWRSPDPFGCYLAVGFTVLIGFQVFVNAGMALGMLPTKGMTLPFVSYGGTSLAVMMTAAGALLSVSGGAGGYLSAPGRAARGACARGGGGGVIRLLIAGGGTGGHLFPGIALAEEFATRHPQNRVLFVGTAKGLEATVVPREGFEIELIEVEGIKRRGLLALLRALWMVPRAVVQSMRILRRWKPDVVVGVGGYASGPVVLAAWLLRIPTAIQEQNALPGITNRVLGRFARCIFTAFEAAERSFPRRKVHLLGNPIRRALMDNYLVGGAPEAGRRPMLFVTGGSQGAHALNLRMVEAAAQLGDLKERIQIVHQTGEKDRDEVDGKYRALGFPAEVHAFIREMAQAYLRADLVVCRAGAATLAELTVSRKPAILVPYPHAADNHQELNAKEMVDAGAAVMIREADLTADRLAQEIRAILGDADRRKRMERASGLLGRPEAAREIADLCVELALRRKIPPERERRRAA